MSDVRGFPAYAAQHRSTRGRSWWARSWVQAMEDTSLDNDQLKRGRRYANSGQVGTITISPGRIAATVYSPEDTYESVVRVDELSADDWRRFQAEVAARVGHIAALLDGEMPHDLVEAAADAGVTLLPGIGDLDPSCTCDAWELPCQHAAALCYQVAWLLDADPFVLLLLRGRTREALLDELQLSATRPTEAGISVADVLATTPAELPDVPVLPAKVGLDELAVTGIEPPDGFGPAVLQLLVLDAARRARAILNALLHGTREPQPLDEWQDTIRLAADFPELTTPLTEATGRDLALGIQAWRYGGAPGLDVLEHTWTPDPAELNRARTELLATDDELAITTALNQLTISADTQLRLDRHGRWHPYRLVDDTWIPAGTPSKDPLVIEW
ncbi:SWIM zinc finger family protein [Kribbella kalugense]|uniref:Putative Zn finger protein n=1 Tax=Kribbella kalugense TaxID=2512221 RepID=A0A4V3G8A9_9ACTN|nr:SWIM zinc finger family protein [Kribbella kalugense]TDW22264.1 putative Zn finger protein [Kribbella kalugense]